MGDRTLFSWYHPTESDSIIYSFNESIFKFIQTFFFRKKWDFCRWNQE